MPTKYSEEQQALYKAWTGEQAQKLESETPAFEPNFMVIVSRHVGRHLSTSTYLFANEDVAKACHAYWKARRGVETLALVHVIDSQGYASEPDMVF